MNKKIILSLGVSMGWSGMHAVAFAHPGHDHNAPQTGFVHYLLSPMHVFQLVAVAALVVGLAIAIRTVWNKKISKTVVQPSLPKE